MLPRSLASPCRYPTSWVCNLPVWWRSFSPLWIVQEGMILMDLNKQWCFLNIDTDFFILIAHSSYRWKLKILQESSWKEYDFKDGEIIDRDFSEENFWDVLFRWIIVIGTQVMRIKELYHEVRNGNLNFNEKTLLFEWWTSWDSPFLHLLEVSFFLISKETSFTSYLSQIEHSGRYFFYSTYTNIVPSHS